MFTPQRPNTSCMFENGDKFTINPIEMSCNTGHQGRKSQSLWLSEKNEDALDEDRMLPSNRPLTDSFENWCNGF